MGFLVLLAAAAVLWLFPSFFTAVLPNLPRMLMYSLKDAYAWLRYRKWRLVRTGEIVAFVGLFGRGKTLSAVRRVRSVYRAGHGLRVYCPRRRQWVRQVVHVVSNVHLSGIPYERFVSLEQVVLATDGVRAYDDEHGTLTVTLVLLDEAASELSHREHKTNFNPLVLNSILTCRHWNISILYTAQRFKHVDILLRQVTSYVLACEKRWRFQFMRKYDAWELEQAENPRNVSCEAILCWFVRDGDYSAYDTYECVDRLRKDMEEGKMMSGEELLALRVGDGSASMDGVRYSRAYRKRHRRLY